MELNEVFYPKDISQYPKAIEQAKNQADSYNKTIALLEQSIEDIENKTLLDVNKDPECQKFSQPLKKAETELRCRANEQFNNLKAMLADEKEMQGLWNGRCERLRKEYFVLSHDFQSTGKRTIE